MIEIYEEIKNNEQYDTIVICVNGSFIHIILENIVYIETRPALPKSSRCTIITEKKELADLNNKLQVKKESAEDLLNSIAFLETDYRDIEEKYIDVVRNISVD